MVNAFENGQEKLSKASAMRAVQCGLNHGMRNIAFDVANHYSLSSAELLKVVRPEEAFLGGPLQVEGDVEAILMVLPQI